MGESYQSLVGRGVINAKYGAPKILTQTKKGVPLEMADFNNRKKDEGGRVDKGAKEGGNRHIDTRQSMGTKANAGGKPSGKKRRSSGAPQKVLRGTSDTGGDAGPQNQPTRRAHLDASSLQKPEFAGSGFNTGFARGAGVNSATYVKAQTTRKKLNWKAKSAGPSKVK